MADLRRLLHRGYFPINIPQCFSTTDYARVLGDPTKNHPGFTNQKVTTKNPYELAEHNLARVGQLRRVLGIPNPNPFYTLAKEICESWSEIEKVLDKAPLSVSRPKPVTRGPRAFAAYAGFPDRPRVRSHRRVGSRYVLFADVQKFYPSVYTHAVPWAIHGKANAKKNRTDMKLLGNRLDRGIRTCQDSQSVGLPIGPDTSWILSELVLAGVDSLLSREFPAITGLRAVDDYELYFPTAGDAERALAVLQSALAAYGLALNQHKTRIEELPAPLEEPWPLKLRAMRFRSGAAAQINDLLSYFSAAFELARQNPTDSVLRFAISRVRKESLLKTSWKVYQELLLQCAIAEPGTLQYVLAALRRSQRLGHQIDVDQFQGTAAQLVDRHLPLGHGSEVAWAVWGSIALRVPIAAGATKLLSRTSDPLVPLLALHAHSLGLAPGLNRARWQKLVAEDELYGPYWLLLYEGIRRKWLPAGKKNPISKHPGFSYLRSHDVSFYRTRASAEYIPRWPGSFGLTQLIGYEL